MMECKAMNIPMASNLNLLSDASSKSIDATRYCHMIGSLMYLMNTRPYIFFAMNTLSKFPMDPRHVHLMVANHAVRYLMGIVDYGLKYVANQNINLEGYGDLDWAVNAIDRKRT